MTGTTLTSAKLRVHPALGVVLVVVSGLLFAVNGTVSKLILEAGVDAAQLTLLRAVGAWTGLLILCAATRPGIRRIKITKAEVPLLIAYGISGFFLVPMLYFVAIKLLPVGIALLFEYTAPLLVALWARFGARQKVRARLWYGLALSLSGLAFVAQVWQGSLALNGWGVAAGLGAAALLCLYYVLGARAVTQRDTVSLTFWAFGVAALAGLITSLFRVNDVFPFAVLAHTSHGVPVWALAIYLVLGGSITSYVLVAAALRHLPATSVGIIGMVEPVIASAVAWVVLDEHLSAAQLIGGALVLTGVGVAETARVMGPTEYPELPPGSGGKIDRMRDHPNVQAVQEALLASDALNAAGEPSEVRVLPNAVSTAVAAAAALGVDVGAIANSLVFAADGEPVLVMTSGAHRVDTAKVAASLGVSVLKRATPDFVRDHTGQTIGGVAPLGHPKPLRTLVDTALEGYPELWAAGGVPHAVFPTTYAELVRLTSGIPTEVA